jgi:D-threo-aldose 1-dehydrogenase
MDPAARRTLGRTNVSVTPLGLGGVALGDLYQRVTDDQADAALQAAWGAGLRYFDTAPWYGRGLSEHRFGRFLYQKARSDFVLSTKVGRILRAAIQPESFNPAPWVGGLPFEVVFDYTYDGIMRAYEDSLQRLGMPRIDMALIHDLDMWYHAPEVRLNAYLSQLVTSGWRALEELRKAGLLRAVGVGINELGMIPRFLEMLDLDFVLLALRYTLMEQDTLDIELPLCLERNVAVVVGAVFNSGLLATGAIAGAKYNYADPRPQDLEKVRRIEAVCKRYGVPLPAAALQFPFGHPGVAALVLGAFTPDQVRTNVEHFQRAIPTDLWAELKAGGLLRKDAPTPG